MDFITNILGVVGVAGIVITLITGIPVVIQLRQHPKGLVVLFFTEMWERFSYYGMRGLLILYLTEQFLFDDTFSQSQYAAYTTLVYLMPLIGGVLADRWLGNRKAVMFGAVLITAGQLLMAVHTTPATQTLKYAGQTYVFKAEGRMSDKKVCLQVAGGCYAVSANAQGDMSIQGLPAGAPLPSVLMNKTYERGVAHRAPLYVNIFYLALSLIIMGVGYLKASIASVVGQLYPQGDRRRDAGFTLYYFGINLGAFWASTLCGIVAQKVGWGAGFSLAGFGMLLGLIGFILGRKWLQGKGEPPQPDELKRKVFGPVNLEAVLYLGGLVGVLIIWWLIRQFSLIGYSLGIGWLLIGGYLLWYMVTKCTKIERERLLLALVLIASSVFFFALFEQAGSSLSQFADRSTQLPNSGFWTINAAQTQSFNAGFILIFAPIFSAIWAYLGRKGRDPNPAIKFGLGLVQVGAGFFALVWGAQFHDAAFRVPIMFLGLAYLLHTTGELCLSPVGLSQMTRLAPAALISTVMATWYLGTSAAQFVAGKIAHLTATDTVGGQVLDPAAALQTYVQTFIKIGAMGIGVGLLLILLSPVLKKWQHGANDDATVGGGGPARVAVDLERQDMGPRVEHPGGTSI